MSVYIPNSAVRLIAEGIVVERAAAVVPTVAQSPQNIFTVSGGRILLLGLFAQVTTVMSATAYSVTIGLTPGAGTSSASSIATGTTALANLEVGTFFGIGQTVAAAVVAGTNASTPFLVSPRQGQVLNAGTVTLTGSATQTGAAKWDLVYVPLDLGASVAAA